jgi:hypothetical protein
MNKEDVKNPIEVLRQYTAANGIMLTLRYIVEREEWFGVIHFTKDSVARSEYKEPIDSYRDSLEELAKDLLKKAEKRTLKSTPSAN